MSTIFTVFCRNSDGTLGKIEVGNVETHVEALMEVGNVYPHKPILALLKGGKA